MSSRSTRDRGEAAGAAAEMSSRSTRGATCSRSSSGRSRHSARVVAQTSGDARLHADFEAGVRPFDYSASTGGAASSLASHSADVSAYLESMQRGQLIQSFGCLLAVDSDSLALLAYSENAPEMLDLMPHAVPSIDQLPDSPLTLGSDVGSLFRSQSAAALQKAASFPEVSLLNPILVHSRSSGKPFYAILHRIDAGLIMDLEPVNPDDVPVTAAGALKSYKLAAKSISRIQSLPSGNISLLCDVLVKEISDLMGYDRVMAYKFHEDMHGEVIAECRRSDLEPYLGLHYPATDIPQASRFLFMKNKVRMICDCSASPVKIIQSDKLAEPLSLSGSTLRAPHGCHAQYMANMGSVASLVMSMTINEEDEEAGGSETVPRGRMLWGLVVCHHTSPRFIPFPLRYACEFLLQVFSVQLNKEVELAAQAKERHILRMQTLLCDMLLREAPIGIFTQSPNVMDLVKCDGAALFFRNQFWLLGSTPSEVQIKDIIAWLLECHDSSTGLSTDSLMEAGYPGAAALRESVCGMAAIKISSKDFIFWFRSHTAKEIKWGGAKLKPGDSNDGRRMHPRTSFKAFLEVVKWRSVPWEDVEMDAIHSLQLILRGSLQEEMTDDNNNNKTKSIVKASSSNDASRIQLQDELRTVTNEMVRLIETANVPILAVDATGNINGWNTKAAELTGLSTQEAVGTPFVDLVADESVEAARRIFTSALQGQEEQNVEIKLKTFNEKVDNGPVILVVNACGSRDIADKVVGVCFIAQDITYQKMIMDKYTRIEGDYVSIVRNPSELIPPIFMIDESGMCVEWNDAMQKLSGIKREDAIGHVLVGEVFTLHGFGCRVKDYSTLTKLSINLNAVISGQDAEKLILSFYDLDGSHVEALLSVNKRVNSEGKIIGALCFLHMASPELQNALQMQTILEQAATNSLNELTYMRQEIRNPLNGIVFTQNLMQSDLNDEQKKIYQRNVLCQEQLTKILDDMDPETIEQCYLELNTVEFNLSVTLETVLMQGMCLSKERGIPLEHDWPPDVSSMNLYGDNLRLQQVLAEFLTCTLQFTKRAEGPILLCAIPRKEQLGTAVQIVHLEFRIIHPAPGVPEALVQEMFHHNHQGVSREGLGLYISQKLVKTMNGNVQYLREAERSSFIILVDCPLAQNKGKRLHTMRS
ncbi:Phytochrome [Rhynchospora pubera]|uniref:Phytochrome n=1 Tax=Rhynchospora pubera TaxID=906938 RepID=A0AAV8GCD0_9POAL|nr:Phytochrome [Rhynchospora pubera]KAJ4800937.1 Phytochrome [Rhynchospora pubera]